jgi:hypothetical protein
MGTWIILEGESKVIFSHSTPVLAVFLLMTVYNGAISNHLHSVVGSIESSIVYKDDCTNESGIGMALLQFSSGNYDQTHKARRALMNFARQSNACRQQVVHALMKAMDKPNLDFERQPSNYYLWREGSQLLGELNAIEALDLLISHLDKTNGFHSFSMVFQPAILGVRQMGQAAVPKLALALKKNPTASVRMAVAYCLTCIGGKLALTALTEAQAGETNQCVANFIKVSLNTFTYRSKSGLSFDNQAPQADLNARRDWQMAFECVE